MAKKSSRKTVKIDAPTPDEKGDVAFPTKSRCPRCGNTETRCVGTDGPIQHRACSAPICRHRWKVVGQKI